jgi:hypothetical protein
MGRTLITIPAVVSKNEFELRFEKVIFDEVESGQEIAVMPCVTSNCVLHEYLSKVIPTKTYVYVVGEEKKSCPFVESLKKIDHVFLFKTTNERDEFIEKTCDRKIRWLRTIFGISQMRDDNGSTTIKIVTPLKDEETKS